MDILVSIMLLLVLLCAGYSICIILGISFISSLVSHLCAFSYHCIIFSSGTFEDNGDFTPSWASRAYCIIPVIIACLSVLVATYQLVKTSVMLYKGKRETFSIAFKMTLSALSMAILVIITGIIISLGFSTWCNAVEERFSMGCEAAAALLTITNNTHHQIVVNGYFADIETGQFSIWSSLVFWVFVMTISGRMLFVAHERANIRISMARERRRYTRHVDYANQPSNLPHRDIT